MRRTALPALACAAALSACNLVTSPHGTAIETERVYTMPPAAALQAPFTVVNRGPGAVQLPTCGDRIALAVERAERNRWRSGSAAVCAANLMSAPLTVEEGGRVESAVPFGAGGTYRIRLQLLDGSEVVSPAFTVR
jgi:hypothetical protein